MDARYIQKRMHEIQNDSSFQTAFGKLVSGKAGYKPVIEKKYVPIRCKKCNSIVEDNQKFCHECGAKIEK
jgi:hypothetical protein